MTLDQVQSVFMALCGPLALVAILRALPLAPRQAVGVAILLSGWFLLTAWTSMPQIGRLPGGLFSIVLPVIALGVFLLLNPAARRLVDRANIPILVGLHVTRLAGGMFVLLAAEGRLANPFAAIAGWGDILAATTAIPAAIIAWRGRQGWEKWVLSWNCFGFLDFVSAISLGITSQPGSPLRIFFEEPGTAILGQLPWRFIPNFFVPLYIVIHIGLFIRLIPAVFPARRLRPAG
jgi:hypothetical protein